MPDNKNNKGSNNAGNHVPNYSNTIYEVLSKSNKTDFLATEPKYTEWSRSAQIDLELCRPYTQSYNVVYSSKWKGSVESVVVSPHHRGIIGDHCLNSSFWPSETFSMSDNHNIHIFSSLRIFPLQKWTRCQNAWAWLGGGHHLWRCGGPSSLCTCVWVSSNI